MVTHSTLAKMNSQLECLNQNLLSLILVFFFFLASQVSCYLYPEKQIKKNEKQSKKDEKEKLKRQNNQKKVTQTKLENQQRDIVLNYIRTSESADTIKSKMGTTDPVCLQFFVILSFLRVISHFADPLARWSNPPHQAVFARNRTKEQWCDWRRETDSEQQHSQTNANYDR
jgi:hypothetical protein